MTIKVRLVLLTTLVLCIATGAIGTVAIGAVTQNMTHRADQQLRQFLRQPAVQPANEPAVMNIQPAIPYSPVALLLVTGDGRIVDTSLAGYSTDRLSPPDLPDPLPGSGQIVTAPSVDGSVDYRMVSLSTTITLSPGRPAEEMHLIAAYPLTELAAIRGNLIATMIVTVILVVIASGVASLWITRRGLEPVESMIDTAAAIADGDLTRRAEAPKHTEMERLAASLNRMVGTLVDTIGDREADQARLRRFIADASHELRTPLATIGGYTELYESGGARSGSELDRAMKRIQSENRRMASLVDDLLLLARFDEGTENVHEPVDLSDLAREVAADSGAAHPEHPVSVSVPDKHVVVRGDAYRLRQLVANLVDNARRHTPTGTPARITVDRQAGLAELTVSDDGPGIPHEHQERVFERLYRVDDSRSRGTGGSGLGLAIVQAIVTAHGGTVTITDAHPGAVPPGTAVAVRLPLAG